MECKEYLVLIYSLFLTSINRNIVECKADRGRRAAYFFYVLIETLWNVKSLRMRIKNGMGLVLIETLWNVKEDVVYLGPNINEY